MVKEEACAFYSYENPTLLSSGKLETKGFCVVSWNRFIAGLVQKSAQLGNSSCQSGYYSTLLGCLRNCLPLTCQGGREVC